MLKVNEEDLDKITEAFYLVLEGKGAFHGIEYPSLLPSKRSRFEGFTILVDDDVVLQHTGLEGQHVISNGK